MFEKIFKTKATDLILTPEGSALKVMQVELDELQMKLDDEYEESVALNSYYNKELPQSGFNNSSDSYDVVDEDIDLLTLQSLYASEGWFYIVVQAVTKAIISLPLVMEKRRITSEEIELPNGQMEEVKNETWIEANGEPEFDLFQHPNDVQTCLEFYMLLIIDLLSLGNCYLYIDKGEGGVDVDRPTGRLMEALRISKNGVNGLYRMNAALMTPAIDEGEIGISSYILNSGEGIMKFDASEIVHIKMPHPGNPFLGLAPIVPVLKNVLIDRFTSEHMIRFYKQGARLGGVIKTTKKLTKEQVTRLTRNFEANFSGKKNHHKTLILPEGMTYETIEVNPGETSLIDFSKFNKEPILSAYAVPPVRVGLLDGATYANALIQDKAFWENAVIPILMILQDGICHSGKIIKRERRLRLRWDISDVVALQDNMKDKADTGKSLADSGWSIDEIREKHWKLPKLEKGEGGSLVPLVERTRRGGMNSFQSSAPGTDEKTQPANAQSDQETNSDITGTDLTFNERVGELTALNIASGLSPSIAAQEAVTRALAEGLLPLIAPEQSTRENLSDPDDEVPAPESIEEVEGDEEAPKFLIPGMDEETLKNTVKALTGEGVDDLIEERLEEVQGIFKRMEVIFQDALVSSDGKSIKADGDDSLPSDKDIAKFAAQEVSKAGGVTAAGALVGAMEVGHVNTLITRSATFPNEEALEIINEDAASKVVGIAETTRVQMKNIISQGFDTQLSVTDIALSISDKFDEIGEGRARTIARTETLSAVSQGQELKKNQIITEIPELEKDMMKAWVNADDFKVRDSHIGTDDQGPIPHNDAFNNGLMFPREPGGKASEVINCRCTVIYFQKTEEEGIIETLADSLIPDVT